MRAGPCQRAVPGAPGQRDRVVRRSLNGVIEQMEKCSSSLNALSSRVEASHLTTAQERELGLRQQDQQLRGTAWPAPALGSGPGADTQSPVAAPALQERLGLQQRDMEEERSRLQEVIGKMEARLSEQSRLLEQVSRPNPAGPSPGTRELTAWASSPSCPAPSPTATGVLATAAGPLPHHL